MENRLIFTFWLLFSAIYFLQEPQRANCPRQRGQSDTGVFPQGADSSA
jgi:hypothetical protein